MKIEKSAIPDILLIAPKRFGDARGYFVETFRRDFFEREAGDQAFVQDNQSFSVEVGTVRGLHFQLAPRAQGKLVRCIAGAILDVAVDIRVGSPTFGQHIAIELSAENGHQLWIPVGFAHGFCTLVANTEIAYKVTDYYSPEHDRGLAWDDPAIGISWPSVSGAVISEKDRRQPRLSELPAAFQFDD